MNSQAKSLLRYHCERNRNSLISDLSRVPVSVIVQAIILQLTELKHGSRACELAERSIRQHPQQAERFILSELGLSSRVPVAEGGENDAG